MPSESEWLWGLMGLKRSVGTVSCWVNSSGWERTELLEPAQKQTQQWIWQVWWSQERASSHTVFCQKLKPPVSLGVTCPASKQIHTASYQTGTLPSKGCYKHVYKNQKQATDVFLIRTKLSFLTYSRCQITGDRKKQHGDQREFLHQSLFQTQCWMNVFQPLLECRTVPV